MSNIGHISGADGLQPITTRRPTTAPVGPAAPARAVDGDQVEISDLGRYMSELKALPEIRIDKVNAVREAIERGDYTTDDKLDHTLGAILEDLEALDEVGT